MVATTNYQAGVETSAAQLAYLQESAWGVPATGQYKQLRYTGESLSGSKSRARSNEIRPDMQASEAITQEESAGGSLNFVLSYGTYDDILSALLGGEWATDVLKAGTVFKSFTLEKKFGAALFLRYPGSFLTGGTLNMARGQFLGGAFTIASKEELSSTTTASTPATYTPANANRVMDPVTGVRDIQLDGAALDTVVNAITLNIGREGAAADYGLGSSAASGARMGSLLVGGTLETYFRTFALYERFKSETQGALSWRTVDVASNAYRFTLPKASIMNPSIVAGGPNSPVMASFTLEGNPDATDGTLMIERIPAAP
ncbi:phage tail tube protein [Teichococcus aestuarii]|uniref:phage tail tube protein n=1 Tax=Teichococcus aestuarii TaxID=568898 RepID=UPI0036229CAE